MKARYINNVEALMGGFVDGELVTVARPSEAGDGWQVDYMPENIPEGKSIIYRELQPEEYAKAQALLKAIKIRHEAK